MARTADRSSSSRRQRTWLSLALLLALHIANSLAWCAAFPLWQGADEASHFSQIQYIAEYGQLPGPEVRYRSDEIVLSGELSDVSRLPFDATQRQVFSDGPVGRREADIAAFDPPLRTRFERQARSSGMTIPPLYHAAASLLYRLAYRQDIIARAFAVRLFSIACSAVGVGFAYLLAREVWPRSPGMWITVPMWVSLQPEFTFLVGGGNTDVIVNLCYTVLLYLMARAARRGMGWRSALLMGIALGCGLLVKPIILFIGPAMALCWVWLGWRGKASWGRLIAYAGLVGAAALSLWGWWAVRSLRINNSLFYENPWLSGESPLPPSLDPNYPPLQYLVDHLISLREGLFTSYWANFGYLDTPVSPGLYTTLRIACVLALLGMGIHAWRLLRRRRFDTEAILFVVLSVGAVMPAVAMGTYGYSHWRQLGTGWPAMGRYLLVALGAQMALMIWGLLSLLPRSSWPHAHTLLRLAALLFNAVCLLGFVLPRYYL